MRAWSVFRQFLAATLCVAFVAPAYPSEGTLPLGGSTPSHTYDAATLSKTRLWGSNEKILLHIRATLPLSEKQHKGYEKCSWKNVVGSLVTYDYDAFGNLIHSTGTTPNNYLFAGEQFDPDLNLYYNRARYLNVSTGRFWTMDSYEGQSRDPQSLHKYLYASGDPGDISDPTGKFGMEDVSAAFGVIATLASNVYIQASTVLTTVYLNLWRLPIIVDQVSQYVTVAAGAISITHAASQALPELARNLLSADQEYSTGPSPRGFQVENAAGVNLSPTNRDFDDSRYGELTQLKSTVQVQTKEILLANIRRAAQNLGNTKGPYTLNLRGGGTEIIQESDVRGKNLLFVIPDEALNFTQQSLLPVIQEIEESEGVQIGIQAVRGLRGQP